MSRISRISSLRANRIRSSYVNKMSATKAVDKIEALFPIEKSKNHTDYPSDVFLASYDRYYKQIKELKKEFKKFYHHEKDLYNALRQLDTNIQKIVKHTDELITKYNQALLALAAFDKQAGTQHVLSIRQIVQLFSTDLAKLGITEEENGLLLFTPTIFISYLEENRDQFEVMLTHFKRMILEEYKSFTRIRLPGKTNPYDQPSFEVKGLFIEDEG